MDKIPVTRSSMPTFAEYTAEICSLWDTHWLTNMGTKHEQFREELKEYLGVEHVALMTNGHMALELAMQAMKLSGEVITTPFTFSSTTHAIVRNGLKPVFCDINPKDYTMDADLIESLVTDQTSAIVPVHVYGNICNIEKIEKTAKKYGLKVIYDAAHTFGEEYQGHSIGVYGDASVYSFHATKVFHSIEGGAVCTADANLAKTLYGLKNFGIRGPEQVCMTGTNAKMNEFCAAMGICNLRHLDEEIAKRKRVAEKYWSILGGVKGIRLNGTKEGVKSNYAYFPVVFLDSFGAGRDEVCDVLAAHGITARKYFYPITSAFDCYRDAYSTAGTPIALDVSKRVLTLPMYADLTEGEIEDICKVILGCKR